MLPIGSSALNALPVRWLISIASVICFIVVPLGCTP